MSFIYPHTVTIKRANVVSSVGDRGYSSAPTPGQEAELFADVACSIQEFVNGTRSPVGLPSDAKVQSQWRIMVGLSACRAKGIPLALGTFKSRDACYDVAEQRYLVWAANPTSLGWELDAVMLEK